jgi:6-phosphogluconate dehydrogenase
MGGNLSLQAMDKGHQVVGYSKVAQEVPPLAKKGLEPADSIPELLKKLKAPRIVFLYIPHGKATEAVCGELLEEMQKGDILVDGGNSRWHESRQRYEMFKKKGIAFLDCGTSGGLEGARNGACFMVGGDKEAYKVVEPILRDLSVPKGFLYAGPAGSGHFTKLIHNGIEFGMLQAIGEGVALLEAYDDKLDLAALFELWSHGSVIRSWLIELLARGLRENKLQDLSSYVEDTREVKWVVEYALDKEIWTPVIAEAELALYRSRDSENVSARAIALMRHGFGGHPLHMIGEKKAAKPVATVAAR